MLKVKAFFAPRGQWGLHYNQMLITHASQNSYCMHWSEGYLNYFKINLILSTSKCNSRCGIRLPLKNISTSLKQFKKKAVFYIFYCSNGFRSERVLNEALHNIFSKNVTLDYHKIHFTITHKNKVLFTYSIDFLVLGVLILPTNKGW